MKLNLGCSNRVIEGWINVDYSLGAKFMKISLFRAINKTVRLFNQDWDGRIYIHDLTKKFPWADSTVDTIYCSHILEHFTREDGQRFLKECHRVLRKNGIIRIIVPDLRYIVREYIEGRVNAENFLENLDVLYSNGKSRLKNKLYPFIQFPHKCMYDSQRLISILNEVGFHVASKVEFDSNITDINQIELKERTENAVIVEGYKR
jgi:predicted SAM-dependent methyltransferase